MKKKFLAIICFIYAVIILYVWFSGNLKYFLAPQMYIYLKISVFPIVIIGIILLLNNKFAYKFKISDIILLLPVLMLILSGNNKLSLNMANNRVTNQKNDTKKIKVDEIKTDVLEDIEKDEVKTDVLEDIEKDEIKKEEYDLNNPFFDITDNIYQTISNYISYTSKAEKLEGRTIRVKGFTLMGMSYLPKNYFMIGKYVVSCCIADANFGGFFVKYDKEVKNNTWYEIFGVLRRGKDNEGYQIMYIDVVDIKEIDESTEEQYVYPCYTYDDSSCKAIQKYNLEY